MLHASSRLQLENTFCSYLHEAEDIKYVVESQDAIIHSHQATEPGGGGHQQQQESIPNSSTGWRENMQKAVWENNTSASHTALNVVRQMLLTCY